MAENRDIFFGREYDPHADTPIDFVENGFHYLSPFSAHEVLLDGIVYKTAEHAYQALRVIPEMRGPIMNAKSPMDAWREGQKAKEANAIVPGYDKDAIMERIFRAKLAQHPDVARILRETGTRELLKVYDMDYYWGTGADDSGENKMGKLWMKIRGEL